jgi:hypothetical protein
MVDANIAKGFGGVFDISGSDLSSLDLTGAFIGQDFLLSTFFGEDAVKWSGKSSLILRSAQVNGP